MLPNFDKLKLIYEKIHNEVQSANIVSMYTVRANGIAESISKMCFGNKLGLEFDNELDSSLLFSPGFGGIVAEVKTNNFNKDEFISLGKIISEPEIRIDKTIINLDSAISIWSEQLEDIFPTKVNIERPAIQDYSFSTKNIIIAKEKFAKPRVIIPAFPGTNSEYDSAKSFNNAGAKSTILPIKNLTAQMIDDTIHELEKEIKNSQIIMLPGGFSAGDEPDGSGKFIAAIFRNPLIKNAVNDLLKNRDGLILGICNGFQALIKLGLVPYGEIREVTEDSPILTFNKIGRHVSKIIYTKVVSSLSPWLNKLKENGQVATQYVDFNGITTMNVFFNPNSSYEAIEGITSPDGRIFGINEE